MIKEPVPGFPGYFAYRDGNILGKRGWLLSQTPGYYGYIMVSLMKDGKMHVLLTHRVLATTFLGLNIEDTNTQVNHKDGNKLNNCIDNLELCTHSENIRHRNRLYKEN